LGGGERDEGGGVGQLSRAKKEGTHKLSGNIMRMKAPDCCILCRALKALLSGVP
jgi:hypothetical protein